MALSISDRYMEKVTFKIIPIEFLEELTEWSIIDPITPDVDTHNKNESIVD